MTTLNIPTQETVSGLSRLFPTITAKQNTQSKESNTAIQPPTAEVETRKSPRMSKTVKSTSIPCQQPTTSIIVFVALFDANRNKIK